MNSVYENAHSCQPLAGQVHIRQRQTGLTLLELMISLSLGLLLLTGIGTIYVGSNQTYRVQEQNARIQESGRYALEVVGRSMRQAGYWNMPAAPNDSKFCLGYTNTTNPPSCNATLINGTDGVGTAADTVTVQFDGVAGDRDCEGNNVTAAIITADDTAAAAVGDTVDNAIVVTDAIRLNGTDLECDGNVDATVDPQPLVSNVEDLQFLYGIDNDGSFDQSADQYVAAPTSAQWPFVVSVRACVLIRSEESGITSSAQRFLTCNGALGEDANAANDFDTAGDSRLRRTFVATFNLRNRVSNLP